MSKYLIIHGECETRALLELNENISVDSAQAIIYEDMEKEDYDLGITIKKIGKMLSFEEAFEY